jgi:hypothetical protein
MPSSGPQSVDLRLSNVGFPGLQPTVEAAAGSDNAAVVSTAAVTASKILICISF